MLQKIFVSQIVVSLLLNESAQWKNFSNRFTSASMLKCSACSVTNFYTVTEW